MGYTDKGRPVYADFNAPEKFVAIESIIAKHLREHPKAICSYSGGSDSDIMLDLLERVIKAFGLPPIDYEYINTGLELQATREHVRQTARKYGITIREIRPKVNVVMATRTRGIPFLSKITSKRLESWQKTEFPMEVREEYLNAPDKAAKYRELAKKYPGQKDGLQYICGCDAQGKPRGRQSQFTIASSAFLYDFMRRNPPDFRISAQCCDLCKKKTAHEMQKDYEMVITGERQAEGGIRSVGVNQWGCFGTAGGKYRLRPLYFVTDADKQWYRERYGVQYSAAYEEYGFKRTGCTGCPFNSKVSEDLERLDKYEPNLAKAARNVFGPSYDYRDAWVYYKESQKIAGRIKK